MCNSEDLCLLPRFDSCCPETVHEAMIFSCPAVRPDIPATLSGEVEDNAMVHERLGITRWGVDDADDI
jgi:hypothetical protein